MTNIAPVSHSALIGGSTAARRIGCPRSAHLESLVPDPAVSSPYAQEGSALHALIASVLSGTVNPDKATPYTYTDEQNGFTYVLDTETWEAKGRTALRIFDDFISAEERRIGAPFEFTVETRVEFPGVPGAFGTSDVFGMCGDELFVIDWKFGNFMVDAVENAQLMFYARAAIDEHSADFVTHIRLTDDLKVNLVIIQPTTETGISVWRTNGRRLIEFERQVLETVRVINERGSDAPYAEGSWCRFAKCRSICPAVAEYTRDFVSAFGALQQAQANRVAGKPSPRPVTEILADLLDVVDVVEEWCGVVREQARLAIENGERIEGWRVEPGRRSPRRWGVPEAEVIERLADKLGGLDLVAPRKLITPTQAEKLAKAVGVELPADMVVLGEPSGVRLVRDGEPPALDEADMLEALDKLRQL